MVSGMVPTDELGQSFQLREKPMHMLGQCAVAIMAATTVGFLTFVTTLPSPAQGIAEDPKPLLVKCDVDPSGSGLTHRRYICKNVLDFGPINPDDYGHSNKDPNDPSNDPRRNHDER